VLDADLGLVPSHLLLVSLLPLGRCLSLYRSDAFELLLVLFMHEIFKVLFFFETELKSRETLHVKFVLTLLYVGIELGLNTKGFKLGMCLSLKPLLFSINGIPETSLLLE